MELNSLDNVDGKQGICIPAFFHRPKSGTSGSGARTASEQVQTGALIQRGRMSPYMFPVR